ncbi:hypothetical protein JCM3774_003853 [Rhodotorula dairenensis]
MARPSWGMPSSSEPPAQWERAAFRDATDGLDPAMTATTTATTKNEDSARCEETPFALPPEQPATGRDRYSYRARQGKWSIQFRHSAAAAAAEKTEQQEVKPRKQHPLPPLPPPPPPPPGPSYSSPAPAPAPATARAPAHGPVHHQEDEQRLAAFVPQDLSMPRVLLDPTWPGFKVSALCLGTFDDRGFGSFAVERDSQLQQGLLDFAVSVSSQGVVTAGGRKGTVGIRGYAFEAFPGIKLSFPAGTVSSFYYSPAPAAPEDEPDLERYFLVIGSRYTPRFYAYISNRPDRHVTSQVRVSAFDKRHARQVPFLSRHFLVVLDLVRDTSLPGEPPSSGSLRDFFRHCELNDLPEPRRLDLLDVVVEKRYGRDQCRRIEHALSTLSPTHAFQLEGILRDGTLSPYELEWLIEKHVKVWNVTVELDRDSSVEEILIELRNLLVENRKARAELLRLGECTPVQLQAMPLEVSDMADRARTAVLDRVRLKLDAPARTNVAVTEREKIESREHFCGRNIVVTPSGTIRVRGRLLEKSNATIRRYYHDVETHRESDHFLRVAFRDEDEQNLQVVSAGDVGVAQRRLLDASITRALKSGITFAGRKYEFLAYSQSGLRDRTVWFVAPWSDVDRHGKPYTITAETIRQQFGLFDKISRMPAKLGARFSQGFTSSIATVRLHHTRIGSRADIAEYDENGKELTNHTDGAGVMSKQLRDKVWQALQTNSFRRDQDGLPPSVYQIRLGGSKGVIALDDRLEGMQVQLRPSQDKFQGFADRIGGDEFCLNVSDAFTRPNLLRLNRPLISALDDLGIPTEVFLAYQKLAIDALSPEALYTIRGAYDTLHRFSFGGATKFKSLLEVLADLRYFDDRLLQEEPFLRAALDVIRIRCLRDLKDRARIPLPDSYVLVGVPDEDRLLEPDQVYACLRFPNRPEEPIYLEGTVVVTRSPAMDPGDIRVLQAVGKLPSKMKCRMQALENCLVLPTRGDRSVASMMGGGDVDGDTYQVITLQDFIPESIASPGLHEAQQPYELDRAASIDDVGDCFVNYVMNDTVGMIAHMHLCLADRSPQHGFDPRCRKLADLYSLAVDAPKTGNVVPASDLPRIKGAKARPDFMRKTDIAECCVPSNVEYYESTRALGRLYRSIDDDGVATPQDMLRPAVGDGLSGSLGRLHIMIKHDLATIFDASPEILGSLVQRHEATVAPLLKAFIAGLNDVAVTHTPARSDGRKLSEVEIYAVTTLFEVQRGEAARGNAVAAMAQHVAALAEWLEKSLTGSQSDPQHTDVDSLEMRYAAWRIAQEMTGEGEEEEGGDCLFGQKTARWLCLTLLLEAIRAEQRRKDDLSLGVTPVPQAPRHSRILETALESSPMPANELRVNLFAARNAPSPVDSFELSASSPRRYSFPSSGSAKPTIPYATRPRPSASSNSTLPTSESVPSPAGTRLSTAWPPADLVTADFECGRKVHAEAAPPASVAPSEPGSESEEEVGDSEGGYVASILGNPIVGHSKAQPSAWLSSSRALRPPMHHARLAEESDDSSDSDDLEAQQARALQALQYEIKEMERLRDEEEARERLYEESCRRARLRGVHVPSRKHEPEAYRIHRADFMANIQPRVEEEPQAVRPVSPMLPRELRNSPDAKSSKMAPTTTGPATREPAPERPRPPPTLVWQQPAYAQSSARMHGPEPDPTLADQRASSRRAQPPHSFPTQWDRPTQWKGPQQQEQEQQQHQELSSVYVPSMMASAAEARWPTRMRKPLSPTRPASPPRPLTSPPPPSAWPAKPCDQDVHLGSVPFWAQFNEVDKARYKSNQTGIAKLGRMMVTSSGQSYRDAYGIGKSTDFTDERAGRSSKKGKGATRWREPESSGTSWLQETEAQLQQQEGSTAGWGWGAPSNGGHAAAASRRPSSWTLPPEKAKREESAWTVR